LGSELTRRISGTSVPATSQTRRQGRLTSTQYFGPSRNRRRATVTRAFVWLKLLSIDAGRAEFIRTLPRLQVQRRRQSSANIARRSSSLSSAAEVESSRKRAADNCRFAGASASWSSSNRPPMSHRKTDLGMPLPYTPSNPSTRPKRVPSKQIATCLFDVIPKESVNSALDFADSSPTILILQTIVAATPQPR